MVQHTTTPNSEHKINTENTSKHTRAECRYGAWLIRSHLEGHSSHTYGSHNFLFVFFTWKYSTPANQSFETPYCGEEGEVRIEEWVTGLKMTDWYLSVHTVLKLTYISKVTWVKWYVNNIQYSRLVPDADTLSTLLELKYRLIRGDTSMSGVRNIGCVGVTWILCRCE